MDRCTHLEAGGKGPYGSVLECFDWEGVLVRTFVLDADAPAIAVDAAGLTLFAVVHEPLPAAMRYKLHPSVAGILGVNRSAVGAVRFTLDCGKTEPDRRVQ